MKKSLIALAALAAVGFMAAASAQPVPPSAYMKAELLAVACEASKPAPAKPGKGYCPPGKGGKKKIAAASDAGVVMVKAKKAKKHKAVKVQT